MARTASGGGIVSWVIVIVASALLVAVGTRVNRKDAEGHRATPAPHQPAVSMVPIEFLGRAKTAPPPTPVPPPPPTPKPPVKYDGVCYHDFCMKNWCYQRPGQTRVLKVKARLGGTVTGTFVYADDSDVPTVMIHSGLLDDGEIGVVRFRCLGAREQFLGTTRHGVQSKSYGVWQFSYSVTLLQFIGEGHLTE
jgi:hypothetical protein